MLGISKITPSFICGDRPFMENKINHVKHDDLIYGYDPKSGEALIFIT